MVQMLFFIRFRGQLRRTKPELIVSLEDAVAEAASAAGAAAETKRKVLTASFDEDRIGFWLDMVIFLEKVHKALEKVSGELYGYALALGQDIPEASFQMLCRSLSAKNGPETTGIWCSGEVRKALEFYIVFDSPGDNIPAGTFGAAGIFGSEGYRQFREWRSFDKDRGSPSRGSDVTPRQEYPYREKIKRLLASGADKNTVLVGPGFTGKRDGIYHYCSDLLGDIPPLVVRFGAGGCGLICFVDAWTQEIRSFLSGGKTAEKIIEELDAIHALLFKERLREEWSPYMADQSFNFIRLLLTAYTAAVKTRQPAGVLILENLSLADNSVARVFREVYASLDDKKGILVLASDNLPAGKLSMESYPEERLKSWGGIFSRILRFAPEDFPAPGSFDLSRKDIPRDLWEVSYNISLLGRYFPVSLFPQLFEEEGLNRDMYFRSLTLLAALGIFAPGEPLPLAPDFARRAGKALGHRKDKIHSVVRKIILAWAGARKLYPCFNLLEILCELGERATDALVLKSLKADVLNGTWEGIDAALGKGDFASLVGTGNAPVAEYIYKTLKVLVWGNNGEIQRIFQEPVPSPVLEDARSCYGAYRAQVQTNLTAFYIGSRNIDAAAEAVRKAMLLNRDLGENAVPAHRLFSLVNLCRKRIDDALEYISFALEQAERAEQNEELVLTCYFASSINFLYGNMSKAERLAARAEETASALGQSGWALRARFLRGRLNFEIGRYEDALEIFESLGTAAGGSAVLRQPEMANTVRAWIERTKGFLGRPSPSGLPVPDGDDGKIFEIETAYFAADYERSKTLAENFLSSSGEELSEYNPVGLHSPQLYPRELSPGEDFLFTEQPDWRSGFAQCENIFLPGKVQAARLAWVYRAMAQCALHPVREAKAEILGGMQRFIRDELLSDTDPNEAFYFYAWYCMLRDSQDPGDSGLVHVDMNTVVSMAYKRLQRRTARIDDMKTKQSFLGLSRWNSTLSLAARDYKLI